MQIPVKEWQGFKGTIMKHLFECDEPILLRHVKMATDEFEYASFCSDSETDIDFAISVLPNGTVHFIEG